MNWCRETTKMGVPPGNRPAVPRDWFRGVPERYVAGADTRGRQEVRPYLWSQQVIHEISGLKFYEEDTSSTGKVQHCCNRLQIFEQTTDSSCYHKSLARIIHESAAPTPIRELSGLVDKGRAADRLDTLIFACSKGDGCHVFQRKSKSENQPRWTSAKDYFNHS